ncbi:amidohydrolase [bacterium]|nr:amidohydrolase [bacterium]
MTDDNIPGNVRDEIRALYPRMVETRRDLHAHPELAFEEERTGGIVLARLTELGYETRRAAKTGVIGVKRGREGQRTLALRADMDALPMDEAGTPPYRSRNAGRMHACGHDGHTSILLAFAEWAATRTFAGNLKLLFQPAEEGPGGAKPMIDDGALENPTVDMAVGLHLWNGAPAGFVGVGAGPIMGSVDEFVFTVVGRGGHGAMPHQTVDSIVVAAHIVTAWQTIVSRETNPIEAAVVTVGQIGGGSNFNIIAPEVRLRGTVRTLNPDLRARMPKRVEEIGAGICRAMGATHRFEWIPQYPVTVNDTGAAELVAACAREAAGADFVRPPEVTLGGEDMSYFLEKVPGCFFFLTSADPSRGLDKPHHHPEFDFDERVMPLGVEIFARVAEKFVG